MAFFFFPSLASQIKKGIAAQIAALTSSFIGKRSKAFLLVESRDPTCLRV
jgi:hypothetical protein